MRPFDKPLVMRTRAATLRLRSGQAKGTAVRQARLEPRAPTFAAAPIRYVL